MAQVSIRHLTTYRYRNPVAFGEHRMMLRPLESFDQKLIASELIVGPEPSLVRHLHDVSGATVSVARFDRRADRLSFESRVRLEHLPQVALDFEADEAMVGAEVFTYAHEDQPELARFISSRHGETVEAWARRFVRPVGKTRLSTLLSDMTHAIRAEFNYAVRLEGRPQTPAETLASRSGSCRDFAVLMIEAARSLGLAAQFVSGYIYAGSQKAGASGGGHTHAWVRVYVPGSGWTDFDPTNGIVGAEGLIRVACVADPRHAIPLHGTWAGLPADFLGMDVEVDIDVEQVLEPAEPMRIAQGG